MQSATRMNPRIRRWILNLMVSNQSWKTLDYLEDPDQLLTALGCKQQIDDVYDLCKKTARHDLSRAWKQAQKTDQAQNVLPARLAINVRHMQMLAGLNDVECRILEFAICLHADPRLTNVVENVSRQGNNQVAVQLASLLELPEREIRAALGYKAALFRTGILDTYNLDNAYCPSLVDQLTPCHNHFISVLLDGKVSVEELLKDSLRTATPTTLKLSDYLPLKNQLDVLLPYLKYSLASRQQGVNMLLYGPPGTGKSELARLLAKVCKTALYELCSEEADGNPLSANKRLAAYRMAQSFLTSENTLLIFDETEEVFESFFGGDKSWINQILESNNVPAIWILNDVNCMDAAFIRRFDMVLELPYPEQEQRSKLLKRYSQGLLDKTTQNKLSTQEHLTPAIIARAARVVGSVADQLSSTASAMQIVIESTLQAQGLYTDMEEPEPEPKTKHDAACDYDPAYIQADADLAAMIPLLKERSEARICLYGPPGTGKTAYGHWLANQLGKALTVCRASDLLAPYVGQTEQNIATAFQQAEESGNILMIDEVDSFLRDRRAAKQSWEAAMVNEMLTQMESFTGIFIASTNLMDGLDQAVLRRFDIKTKFDFLRPEQAWSLFEKHRKLLGLKSSSKLQETVRNMAWLTPGDFAAVRRQVRFNPAVSALDLQQRLATEMGYKEQANKRRIGF